jgi:hypothetical protein
MPSKPRRSRKARKSSATRSSKFWVRRSKNLERRTSNRRPSPPSRFSRKSRSLHEEGGLERLHRFLSNSGSSVGRIFSTIMR